MPLVKLKFKNRDAEVVDVTGDVRVEVGGSAGFFSTAFHPEGLIGVEYVSEEEQAVPEPVKDAPAEAAPKKRRKP